MWTIITINDRILFKKISCESNVQLIYDKCLNRRWEKSSNNENEGDEEGFKDFGGLKAHFMELRIFLKIIIRTKHTISNCKLNLILLGALLDLD